jgi:hypothetical protein
VQPSGKGLEALKKFSDWEIGALKHVQGRGKSMPPKEALVSP